MKSNILLLIAAFLMAGAAFRTSAQNITTFAGTGAAVYSGDGVAATATGINNPYGVAVDAAGNVYIADYGNNRIRKVSPAGVISTIAGTSASGFYGDGGPATAAQLNSPRAIAVDAAGNVYFTDYVNLRIRKITASTGIITTVAGDGMLPAIPLTSASIGDGGPATNAHLNYAWGIAVDNSGNLYIADQLSQVIRKVNSSGIISTIAGTLGFIGWTPDGPALSGKFNNPTGVAVDAGNNVYVADYSNNRVRKINSSTGILSTIGGTGTPFGFSGDGGPATAARFYYPMGIAVDGPGNVYLSDRNNGAIRKINTSGIISTVAGTGTSGYSGDGGPAVLAQLNMTTAVAVQNNGDIYISDNDNNRIRYINIGNAPYFTVGASRHLTVCTAESILIDSVLKVDDIDVGQIETWSAAVMPVHGSIMVGYTATSTGSTLTPSGLSYIPGGYVGDDSFKVQVSDGLEADTITIYITVLPVPFVGDITGPHTVCPGQTVTLANASPGGTWSSSSTATASIGTGSGIATGVAAGTAIITYSFANMCGSASDTFVLTVLATVPCISMTASPGRPLELTVLPQPSTGSLQLLVPSAKEEQAEVTVTDLTGRMVQHQAVPTNRLTELQLDQPSGIYLLSVSTSANRWSRKINIVK